MQENHFPIGETVSKDEAIKRFDLRKETPFENPELAYKILIPKTWVAETIYAQSKDLEIDKLKPLGIYKGPAKGGANPFVQIQATRLTREVSAANWLRLYAILTNRKMIAAKSISAHFADCVMGYDIEGAKFMARATALINGDRLFYLANLAIAGIYEEYKETFGVCVVSFNLQNPFQNPNIEKQAGYSLKEIVRFRYPVSWKYREATETPDGKEGVDILNVDPDNNIIGKIRVKSVEKRVARNVDTEIEAVLEEYKESSIMPGELIETINIEIGGTV